MIRIIVIVIVIGLPDLHPPAGARALDRREVHLGRGGL